MTDAASIARARKGVRTGTGWLICCPCPSHGKGRGDRNPSLSISDGRDGLILFCHGGCDSLDVLAELRRQGLLDDGRRHDDRPRPAPKPVPVDDDRRAEWIRTKAVEMFCEAVDPRGTLVERYLDKERSLPGVIDDTLAQTLRYHARCAFRNDAGEIEHAPAMVAAFRPVGATFDRIVADYREHHDLEQVERDVLADPALIVAVHRTRLDASGRKVARKVLGPMKGAAIFLSPPTGALDELSCTLSEGIESGLSAVRRGFGGGMALGSSSNFYSFEPLQHINSAFVAAERDAASERAVADLVSRWTAAGKTITVLRPLRGIDFNDLDRGAA